MAVGTMAAEAYDRAHADRTSVTIEVQPIAGALGAEIFGVDLTHKFSDSVFADIYQALHDHLVIFFPRQRAISSDRHLELARLFGEVDEAPFTYPFKTPTVDGFPQILTNVKEASDNSINVGGFWHADVTYRERPHKIALLYAKEAPRYGGDTMFANQYLAYETLSNGMKKLIADLRCVHSSAMPYGGETARFGSVSRSYAPTAKDREFSASLNAKAPQQAPIENEHPVVRTHPETGRKCLYVNRGFAHRLVDMTADESWPLLEQLWTHAVRGEFTCRYRWAPNDLGIWDNRCVLHYALNDYSGARREMHRISVHEASRPV